MTATILYLITALLSVITVNEACKCAVVHPQTNFCNADFAIRAKVLSESQTNSSKVYIVKILKTFKGTKEITPIIASQVKGKEKRKNKSKVAHITNSAVCGVSLDQSKTYLLLGYIDEQQLRIDSCKWHALWTSITAQQRRGLKTLYGQNCACRIEKYCFKRPTERCDNMIGGCDIPDADMTVGFCKRKNAYCKKRGDECKWIIAKKSFQKCISSN